MSGYFLGGAATGFLKQEEQNTADQKQALLERIQNNSEQQQQNAGIQKQISDTMSLAKEITQKAAENGKDPQTVAKAIQPLIDSASGLAQRIYGPDGATRVQQMGAALLAQPASQDKETYTTHVVTDPTTLKQSIVRVGKNSGQVKAFDPMGNELPAAPVATPTTPPGVTTGPQPPSTLNLTGPGAQVTGVDVQPLNDGGAINPTMPNRVAGANPVPDTTSAPPQPAPAVPEPEPVGGLNADTIKLRGEMLANGDEKGAYAGLTYKNGVAAKIAITNYATALSKSRNQGAADLTAKTADVTANKKSLVELTTMKNAIEQFENTAVKNGDILVNLAQKVDQTGVPLVERWTRAGRQATGDTDVAAFNTQMVLWRAEVARILTNPTLKGVLTDTARAEIEQAIQPGASFEQIKRVNDLLKGDFSRRGDSIDEQIVKVKGKLGFNPTQQAAPQQAPAAQSPATHKIITPGGSSFWVNP